MLRRQAGFGAVDVSAVRIVPQRRAPRARRSTIQRHLTGLTVTGALLFAVNYQVGREALNDADQAARNLAVISDAVTISQSLEEVHDELLGAVRLAHLELAQRPPNLGDADLNAGVALSNADRRLEQLEVQSRALRAELLSLDLPPDLLDRARALVIAAEEDLTNAARASDQVVHGNATDWVNLAAFETASAGKEEVFNTSLAAMIARRANARTYAAERTARERQILLAGSATGAVALFGLGLAVQVTLTRSMRRLGATAEAMARGDLAVRAVEQGPGDVRDLARSFNALADSLADMISGFRAESAQVAFDSRLGEALDMVDNEYQSFKVLADAMTEIVPGVPAELLLTDGERGHLDPVAINANGGAAGCGVDSPGACVAVRRGTLATFDSSRALNACPHLRERSTGPCSAVCVPVTFMGQALGVLHARTEENALLDPAKISSLQNLATLTGARIGTLRALAQTRLQALTDPLTGLSNRRDGEPRLQRMLERHDQAAIVMVDLDRFKMLNDTYGHSAGDRALRTFAHTLTQSVRDIDLVCRWGGEEFVLGMPGLSVEGAAEVVERIRLALEVATVSSGSPPFTASFGLVDMSRSRLLEPLLRSADEALFEAKESGRNCYRIASGMALVDRVADPTTAGWHETHPLEAWRSGHGFPQRPTRPSSAAAH